MMHASGRTRKPRRRRAVRAPLRPLRRSWLLLVALLAGCPARFDPRADPVGLQAADPALEAAYRDARARLDRGDVLAARDALRDLRTRHSTDPVATASALWEARADLQLGDSAAAAALTEPLAGGGPGDPVAARARFILGLSLARNSSASTADATRARGLLAPFAQIGLSGDDGVELWAALAASSAALGDVPAALDQLEHFYEGGRPVEKSYVRARAQAIAAGLPDADARRLYSSARPDGLARAALGDSLASRSPDPVRARTLRADTEEARRRFGFLDGGTPRAEGASSVRAIGVILPLSGKSRPLGERALRGVLVGANVVPPLGQPLDVRVRDSGSKPEQAALAVEELAREGAVAVIASPERTEAAAIAARASALGLPVVDLAPEAAAAPGDTAASYPAFHVLRPNTARAEALAAVAREAGARRYATLAPDTPYGRRMAEAFAATARASGGEVVAELKYPEKTTTFIAPAKQLGKARPDAVFVPATASQLELVSAQLAAAGVTRAERDAGGKPQRGSVATLYATADGLGPRFLANAGRYAQGAVLAPVYQGPQGEPGSAVEAALQRFRTACGEDPGAADAIAFDAVVALREAIARVRPDEGDARRAVASGLGAVRTDGLTGPVAFSSTGERTGRPPLFVVEGAGIRPLP